MVRSMNDSAVLREIEQRIREDGQVRAYSLEVAPRLEDARVLRPDFVVSQWQKAIVVEVKLGGRVRPLSVQDIAQVSLYIDALKRSRGGTALGLVVTNLTPSPSVESVANKHDVRILAANTTKTLPRAVTRAIAEMLDRPSGEPLSSIQRS